MARYGNSPLRGLKYPDHLPFIGNENTKYTITLPNNSGILAWYTRDLLTLPVYYKNVECVIDHEKITQKLTPRMAVDPCGFFLVNDSVFKINYNDRPIDNWERWVPHESQVCTAFFILALRHSTSFIFDNCPIPVFPFPNKLGDYLDPRYLEYCHSLNRERKTSIFFNGRGGVREARKYTGNALLEKFTDAHIKFLDYGEGLTSKEYIDLMSQSKIAWCPRSVWSPPDRECNCPNAKEVEAMCLETMVIKHSIGITEAEERVPGVHFVEYKNDDSDLIEKLHYYLEHEDERKEIAHNGRLWYERNCSVSSRAVFVLRHCLEAMGEPCDPSIL